MIDALTPADGGLHGLPMGYNVQSLFYNKDMFDAAGLDYPPADGSYTYDDLREWSKKLTLDQAGVDAGSAGFNPEQIAQWGCFNFAALPIPQGDICPCSRPSVAVCSAATTATSASSTPTRPSPASSGCKT